MATGAYSSYGGGGGYGAGGGGGGGFSGHMESVPCEGQEGRIIGRGGENIRGVESQTGTRIKMNRVANVAEVTVRRNNAAIRMIQEYIHTARTEVVVVLVSAKAGTPGRVRRRVPTARWLR